ncbi:MAG TPA: bh protein [Bacillus sp. (in: firmicutes)]|uniref:bh protein n=1 Tax=Bacillus litorisediminis TaxID=2922713 RepID=UPI001FAC75C6|nr:bh protein [Bacillus litorisediminis]HWO78208.1 bh protein [Bacillus sp. (in: firmicutes)]
MKQTKMEASLYCLRCKDETPHTIVYINNEITSVCCDDCKRTVSIQVDIMKEFYKEIYERIFTKPSRITKEYKEDLSYFLTRLPFRVASKPYRLIRDLNESRKIIKQYRNKKKSV